MDSDELGNAIANDQVKQSLSGQQSLFMTLILQRFFKLETLRDTAVWMGDTEEKTYQDMEKFTNLVKKANKIVNMKSRPDDERENHCLPGSLILRFKLPGKRCGYFCVLRK